METPNMPHVNNTRDGDVSMTQLVTQVVSPFLMLTAVLGTIMTVRALRQSEVMTSGPRTYFTVLTVADLLAVVLSFTRFWVAALPADYDIFSSPAVVCKLLPALESVALMVPPWLLVAMAIQVFKELTMKVNPGLNVTPWKARVYAGFVCFIAVLVNFHPLMFFHIADDNRTSDGATNVSTNAMSDTPGFVRTCVPQAGGYEEFYVKVWPWMSLSASLSIPLLVCTVLSSLILRRLVKRSKQDSQVPLLTSFRQMVVAVPILCLVTVLMSGSLWGFAYIDARKYWTDYPYTIVDKEGDGTLLNAWFVFRLVFCGQFCIRWTVTCWCCQLWSIVRSMWRCKKRETRG